MIGHKRIPSREGGVEIVVEELATRMVERGNKVTCLNRAGHHVSGKEFDEKNKKEYKGIRLKTVPTLDKKGLAAMTASVTGGVCAAFGKYDVVFMQRVLVPCYGYLNYLGKDAWQQFTDLTTREQNGENLQVHT